jgi:hypothetical protein
MARGIRFRKPERELIGYAVTCYRNESVAIDSTKFRLCNAVLEKLAASEAPPPKPSGVSCSTAIDAFRSVLGPRLVVPPNPGAVYWVTMTRKLQALGVTREQCVQIATVAAEEWQGKIKAESLVNQGAVLLATGVDDSDEGVLPNAADEDEDEL